MIYFQCTAVLLVLDQIMSCCRHLIPKPVREQVETPITPVITEALTSLHDLIVTDTHVLNATNKDRLQKCMQKLASAAEVLFAAQALLKDRNRFLLEINREAKARRSTKSLVLGKAKMMSCEDPEKARAKARARSRAAAVLFFLLFDTLRTRQCSGLALRCCFS